MLNEKYLTVLLVLISKNARHFLSYYRYLKYLLDVGFVVFSMAGLPQQALATVPIGFNESIITSGLTAPIAMAVAPDGRIFITEQLGRIRIIKQGQLLVEPFLDIVPNVDSSNERGLLGITLDPNFNQNHWVYVFYTSNQGVSHNRISRFTASDDISQSQTEKVLLDMDPLSSKTTHNGGALHFGKEGLLYAAVGNNQTPKNSQSFTTLKGKFIRIFSDGRIPATNPFYNKTTGINRAIWSLGLRNPFTFAVQPGTGRIFINDVGLDLWEEINIAAKGANYGWPVVEGIGSDPLYKNPLFVYPHSGSSLTGCAIVGGTFYNPLQNQFPIDYVGDYYFSDFCMGWIRQYDLITHTSKEFASGFSFITDLQVSSDGTFYVLEHGGILKAIKWMGP